MIYGVYSKFWINGRVIEFPVQQSLTANIKYLEDEYTAETGRKWKFRQGFYFNFSLKVAVSSQAEIDNYHNLLANKENIIFFPDKDKDFYIECTTQVKSQKPDTAVEDVTFEIEGKNLQHGDPNWHSNYVLDGHGNHYAEWEAA